MCIFAVAAWYQLKMETKVSKLLSPYFTIRVGSLPKYAPPALFTRPSTWSHLSFTLEQNASTEPIDVKSRKYIVTLLLISLFRRSFNNRSPLSIFLPEVITSAPCCARKATVSKPDPDEPPVTTYRFPAKFKDSTVVEIRNGFVLEDPINCFAGKCSDLSLCVFFF